MALYLPDLDDRTRRFMLDELEADRARRRLYLSPYLTELGRAAYEGALRAAIVHGTEASLADALRGPGRMALPAGWKQGTLGQGTLGHGLPTSAPDALAEAEFHRFYVRGLCRRSLAEGIRTLVIYRAKVDAPPRANADGMVGVRIDAASLLEDLQATSGQMPPRVLHGCPHPGMSVRLPFQETSPAETNSADAGAPWLSKAERRRAERRQPERRTREHPSIERAAAEPTTTRSSSSDGR